MYKIIYSIILLLVFTLTSCSDNMTSEEQIRELVATAEEVAEKKDIRTLNNLIDQKYQDKYGNFKNDTRRIIAGYYIRKNNTSILTNIKKIEISSENNAKALIYIAMAQTPIPNHEALSHMRADLYQTSITLKKSKGDWLVTSSQWRSVNKQQFLSNITSDKP